jgi:hypothetical protein
VGEAEDRVTLTNPRGVIDQGEAPYVVWIWSIFIFIHTEIGAGGILKQAGRYPGTYKLRTYKFANNSLAKP